MVKEAVYVAAVLQSPPQKQAPETSTNNNSNLNQQISRRQSKSNIQVEFTT
jgi:hypothetical protein